VPFDFRKNFLVKSGDMLDLTKIDPSLTSGNVDKLTSEPILVANNKRLTELQTKLYAAQKESILIILQGMDAAGKDGVVTRIFGPLNPLGCETHSFKVPSEEESAHDFLWRVHKYVPAKGWIGIFNRSHYEAVLVERVHNLVPPKIWEKRYKQINDFEDILTENGTHIIKFFLHIDKNEQLERFKERLDDPSKQWKISNSDYSEREYWDDYQKAYEVALAKTSQPQAPWYVIPANKKWFRNLAISQIIADTMDDMKIAEPKVSVDIAEIKRKYHAASIGNK
jgi:PPK2 family polyphosphate:nucleotide phosphotransferase